MEKNEKYCNLVAALNQALEIFTSNNGKTFDDVMTDGLRPIADAAGLDSIIVYSLLNNEAEKHFGQVYRWVKEEGGIAPINESLRVLPNNPTIKRWIEALSKGSLLTIKASGLDEDEKAFLDKFGVTSILLAPVFTKEKLWGAVSFQNHHIEQYFDEESTALLNSAARLCANFIIRSEMEGQIASANALNRSILNTAPVSITVIDDNLNVIDCNDSSLVLMKSEKKYYLDNFFEFSPEYQDDGQKSKDKAMALVRQALEGSKMVFEWTHRSLTGELIPTEVTLIRVVHNERYMVLGYQYDLRNIKEMTESIRTQSVLLKDALKQATTASRAKSDFLSNMSHEMRTPMNAIIGMTAIGKGTEDIERKDYALTKIEEASVHLLGVINDVLDMAKIEANRLELSPVEYNFEKMLQKVVGVVNFRVDGKRQRLSVAVDSKIPTFLLGDDHRLAQVITNLLSNAVKFTPEEGEISLKASLIGENNGTCELQIEVADSGIGISGEQQKKLFSAFRQAESGTSREFGGTGLGLTISKRIVELMGGRIWVESELKKGARFFFTVKALRGNNTQKPQLNPDINWKTIRILAVDDEKHTRDFFENLFKTIGVHCDVASDGFQASQMIEKHGGYDICFIDWRMPGMDGIELSKRIKSKKDAKPCVVTIITAADWADIESDSLNAGVDKYLFKPLFSSMIIDFINEYFGIKSVGNDKEFQDHSSGEFTGKKLLLAEDIEINREIIISLLENTGISIECAENGKVALDMVQAEPEKYDVIFMDMQMPQMDGLEATSKIRAFEAERYSGKTMRLVERPKGIPIIAMTANVFKDDIKECLEAGMDVHIGKPLDIDDLFFKLRKYLIKEAA